ncbi:ABC-2 type transporter-domain-containing protein [Scheffersomyces coipomensis]|uniref:ABC-2 type transporter-domain-containing protein n=1 Tax=Scheffersomyces coipomensis TaxID=1788519 RepID=UPI00315CF5F3
MSGFIPPTFDSKPVDTGVDLSSNNLPYDGVTSQVRQEIRNLARTMTRTSFSNVAAIDFNKNDEAFNESELDLSLSRKLTHLSDIPGQIPMVDDEHENFINPKLNPHNDEFDYKFWIKNMQKLILSDIDYYKPTTLGLVYKDLRCYGHSSKFDYQSNVLNVPYKFLNKLVRRLTPSSLEHDSFDILKPMEGLCKPGTLTVVLGRPSAGCTTLLKTLACHTYGFHVGKESVIRYNSLTPDQIQKHYRGDVVYCAETENHFPHLTVFKTLELAALLRTPQNIPLGVSRELYAKHLTEVYMATFGLSHTKNTKVGNDYVRGVSGGERKRVSIAEVAISQGFVQCWDNSTRGLDSATALEFLKALRTSADITGTTPLIAIYQCSQDSYELFDNVSLLYEGYQIYFGNTRTAKEYFTSMGWECPQRQTTADFLTSLTNPSERTVSPGFEDKVPRTAKEFYDRWLASPQRAQLLLDIDAYLEQHSGSHYSDKFKESHVARQSKHTNPKSSYTVSFLMQVRYIIYRDYLRNISAPTVVVFHIIANFSMSLLISSIFYNLPHTTGSFYYRTAAMFFAILFNAFSCIIEVFNLYEARPIVEKHKTYALYHPAADALASIIMELPSKIIIAIGFNLVYYFMVHFRREPGRFFFYLLINFVSTLAMSHIFRTIGAATKTLSEAMTPAALMLLGFMTFTGFVIPTPKMLGWCRWINYIDPIAYTFEALMANEFHDTQFECSQFVPSGAGYPQTPDNRICSVVGSQLGQEYVNGDDFIGISFEYYNSHKWRNFGIIIAFTVFFLFTYIILCEFNKGAMQKGEILVFQERALRQKRKAMHDTESGSVEEAEKEVPSLSVSPQDSTFSKFKQNRDTFHWRNLTYQVKIKSEDRVLLNRIDGWVKPGQLTALMGCSGAGKTTLLNALSERLTAGVITDGIKMVNGRPLDTSFQRSIGYVQQQDLHLDISTVREALRFSAYLRQPKSVSTQEKRDYVESIIDLLDMQLYADAVVGVAGEGLNVEQRKRLTIGVELVAKPDLLLFLDEPTSGLDSQTAWSICKLIRKLADHGQAILCTIHQPSALLLQEFDRLLFLQQGGETVYFGDLGENCQTLIEYFERNSPHKCPREANPAEWMLEVIGAAPGSHAEKDYYDVWRNSSEYQEVVNELDRMETELVKLPVNTDPEKYKLFARSLPYQYLLVTKRVLQQYWRTPSFTYSKILNAVLASLFNGFSFFKADRSLQGLQNQMFSVFLFFLTLMTCVLQYLPHFVAQRSLYEVRERPSRTFSWFAFICAQITGELPWNILAGTLAFFSWYYPVGLYSNAVPTDTVHERGALMWLSCVLFYMYIGTLAQLVISFIEIENNAGNICVVLFNMCLNFCGVLVPKNKLPGFWIFMYRFNPVTYLVGAFLGIGLADSDVTCSADEILKFVPAGNLTCGEFMQPYMAVAGGYLVDESSTSVCEFCTMKSTNVFLKTMDIYYSERGRNIGVFIGFICFNIVMTIFFYYLARVPKKTKRIHHS